MNTEHISSPHCWCDPTLIEPGIYLHHDIVGEKSDDRADKEQHR